MLLCSSKIPVANSFTPTIFIDLAIEWVINSRNYEFEPFMWDGAPDFICAGKKGEVFQVGLFEDESICAIHFTSTDNRSIKWTTDYILDIDAGVLAFQLYRDAPSNIDCVHKAFSIPFLVKKIISSGHLASDNDVEVTSKPILIHDEDADWVANMMLRETSYNLPIVYMSCETDGHCVTNPYMVAEKLNGVAHVFFETSRSVSYELRDKTDGINPYGGAVEIFYPRGNRKFLPSQLTGTYSHRAYSIVNAVFNHMNQLRVEERFSWSQLQANRLRKQLSLTLRRNEQDSKDYQELETTYEELLAEKDSQIQRLSDQLASANITIEQLEIQLTAVEDIPVLVLGEEQDLYPFEQKSMLIEILERELRSTKANSRKAHILTALLNANKCDNTVDEKRKRIKACLHGYSKMTAAIRKELEDIGFSLSDDGKHVKAVFGEDQRYMGTLSKTGSDHRAGDNIAHDLIRLIF